MVDAARPRESHAGQLLIFPCNGNGLEALDCLCRGIQAIGFIDDNVDKHGREIFGLTVFDRSAFERWPAASVLAQPGGPQSYRSRLGSIESLGVDPSRWARVISPAARVSPLASIGHNVLIMAGVVVTSNAVIGDHVCVLPNSVIHHDAVIGPGCLIGSNVTIAGGVVVEPNCYIASGTSLMNGVRIGRGALVGMGSTVIRAVAPMSTVAGNPARLLR